MDDLRPRHPELIALTESIPIVGPLLGGSAAVLVASLHPLAIVVALVIGSALLGIPGAILAVPTAAIVQVLVVRVIAPSIRARTSM